MFGISPLGWVHTLGSLPAIPVAAYMFARRGRIVPKSAPGIIYLVSMVIGATTVFLVARQPVSYGIGLVTLIVLGLGYGASRLPIGARAALYLETICLTVSTFLLMLPTVTEILRRVPDAHPFVTDLKSPVLLGAQATLLAVLLLGLAAQIIYLRRRAPLAARAGWN